MEYWIYLNGKYATTLQELPTKLEVRPMHEPRYDGNHHLIIDDHRDIAEMKRRKKEKLPQPALDELYTYNPGFDGNYKY